MSTFSRMTQRLPVLVPAAVLTAALLSACGGGDDNPTLGSSPTPSAKPLTSVEAKAAANAINLTDADVAGFKGTAHEDDSSSTAEEKEFATCVGASDKDADLTDTYSKDYERGSQPQMQTVSSEVQVDSDPAQLAKDLAAFQAADKVKTCLTTSVTKLLQQEVGQSGVTFSTPVVAELKTTADGTDGAFGYRVTITAMAQGITIPFEITEQGVLKGHTTLSFSTMSIGTPIPAADRDALLAKLVDRLKDKAV